MNHLPRVNSGQTRGVWFSGDKDGERFAPGDQSPVPPPRRSSLQRVNWVNKHRCVRLVLILVFTFSLYITACLPSMFPLTMDSLDDISPYFISRLFFLCHCVSCYLFECFSSILSEEF